MNDKEYAIYLADKLSVMLKENYDGTNRYNKMQMPEYGTTEYWEFYQKQDEYTRRILDTFGRVHSKAEITRARIELNKTLIRLAKYE